MKWASFNSLMLWVYIDIEVTIFFFFESWLSPKTLQKYLSSTPTIMDQSRIKSMITTLLRSSNKVQNPINPF